VAGHFVPSRTEGCHRSPEGSGSTRRRRATKSATTKAPAVSAAPAASRLPIILVLARLATTSRQSLAAPIAVHRRNSASEPRLAAFIPPNPRARSRIPTVRRSKIEAPGGASRPDRRKKRSGQRIRVTPTALRSALIVCPVAADTIVTYSITRTAPRSRVGAPLVDANPRSRWAVTTAPGPATRGPRRPVGHAQVPCLLPTQYRGHDSSLRRRIHVPHSELGRRSVDSCRRP